MLSLLKLKLFKITSGYQSVSRIKRRVNLKNALSVIQNSVLISLTYFETFSRLN